MDSYTTVNGLTDKNNDKLSVILVLSRLDISLTALENHRQQRHCTSASPLQLFSHPIHPFVED